jgi:ADP-ribose pyrophosphatase YjhB (NUDIX family)
LSHDEAQSDRPVRRARKLAAENSRWRVHFDHIADGERGEVSDYLVLSPKAMRADRLAGVVVLPVLPDGRIALVRIWRHAVERFGWEAARGFIDEGETAAAAARRELAEETGLAAADLVALGFCAPEGSTIASRAALFAALGCRPCARPDEAEPGLRGYRSFTRAEIAALADGPELEDALTLLALYRYRERFPAGG